MKTALLLCIVLAGCRTEFVGDPHVAPAACQSKCAAVNMRMTGMVYMGEYSSACICEIAPPAGAPLPPPPPTSGPPGGSAGGAAAAAAAGVVMQMRQQQQQQQQRHP
jgi:hypothetical protein